MSGISGIVQLNQAHVDRKIIEQMAQIIYAQGPDALHTVIRERATLSHSLLATIDEANRVQQPLVANDQIVIVADARIDDRARLCELLDTDAENPLASSATDVQLILQAYIKWGEACVNYLIGDFVFAIWDDIEKRLFCARDQLGVKPFYYSITPKCLLFSNSLEALCQVPSASYSLNETAIADFILFGTNQDTGTTYYKDIQRLPPGHILQLRDGSVKIQRYWNLEHKELLQYSDWRDYVSHFDALLGSAVKDRMRGSPVAIALSGGMDSSAIAAHAATYVSDALQRNIHAYILSSPQLAELNEELYAAQVADFVKIPLHRFQFDKLPSFHSGTEIAKSMPSPGYIANSASSRKFMTEIERKNRVLLSGHGGDIILKSAPAYFDWLVKNQGIQALARPIYLSARLQHRLPPLFLRLRLQHLFQSQQPRRVTLPAWLHADFIERCSLAQRYRYVREHILDRRRHPYRHDSYVGLLVPELSNLLESRHPSFSHHNVEIRYPFLDLRLVDFALSIPSVPWCTSKFILRKSMEGKLPEAVLNRPKTIIGYDSRNESLREALNWEFAKQSLKSLDQYVIPDLFLRNFSHAIDARETAVTMYIRVISLGAWMATHT